MVVCSRLCLCSCVCGCLSGICGISSDVLAVEVRRGTLPSCTCGYIISGISSDILSGKSSAILSGTNV